MAFDTDPSRPAPASPGGAIEPARHAAPTKTRSKSPIDLPGERYELRDPFSEVTYRTNAISEVVAKAEQLGSSRFIALDAQGKRTTVQKVDGEWQRGPQRAAAPERPVDLTAERDEVPQGNSPRSKAPARVAEAKNDRAALVARLEAALVERYLIKQAPVTVGDLKIGHTEYRFRGDTSRVAFTESTFRLATDTNSPSVARSMVDVAEARNWHGLRISGNEDFRRMVWLEASVRGFKTQGYEPNLADNALLQKEREARLLNRIEPARHDSPGSAAGTAEKPSARGSSGRKTVLAAIEAVLVAKRVPEKQRSAVMAAATEQLAQRLRDGQSIKVKVYDKAAPTHRQVNVPTPEMQRSRERASPAR